MGSHREGAHRWWLSGWLLLLISAAVAVVLVAVFFGPLAATPGTPGAQSSPARSSGAARSSTSSPACSQVAGQTVTAAIPGPAAGKRVAFADEFDSVDVGPGQPWGYTTTAFEDGNRNPKDHKLDSTTPSAMTAAGGVLTITATPRADHFWNTGLLTTEPSSTGGNGFRVQAGDFLVTRVRMPSGNSGGWPALWTWLNGNGELDVFEWHSDNPHLLELSNRIRSASKYYTNAQLVAPCAWVWIGVQLGADDDTWFVGADSASMQPVFSDHKGIGGTRPYIIAGLSVSDGTFHEAPRGSAPIVYAIDSLRVYR